MNILPCPSGSGLARKALCAAATAAAACLGTLLTPASSFAADINGAQQSFLQPPDDARIMVRWWWFGPAVTHAQLEREMNFMKEGGIGGFEVQQTYPLALDGELPGLTNLKFLSPEALEALHFVSGKAKELGLRMNLTLGSGWPYGGPQFTAEEGATAIQTQNLTIPGGQRTAPLPSFRAGQKLIAAFVKNGGAYVEVPVVDNVLQVPAEVANPAQIELFISRGGIMAVKRPAYGADGNVIDHYSPTVIAKFIKELAEPSIKACEPNPLTSIFCDSLEVAGENWTPNFLAEFQKRRGYDLRPLLPALFNDIGPKTLEIRQDWGQTVTELFNDDFIGAFHKLAAENKTQFRIQAYGTPPTALFSYAAADWGEGESYQWNAFSFTRWASSANHLIGRPVTSAEAFTWLHSPVFRATPLDIKGEADLDFLNGVNQFICHGWPYTAEGVAYPGWSFYAAAVFNEKNPWWIVMPDVAKYLQRVSSLLRQGAPANDVALFLSNGDAWASLGARNFSLTAYFNGKVADTVRAIVTSGYNLDFFDDQLLDMRGKVAGKELAFGDSKYRVVVLPAVQRVQPATMRKLEQFARAGGIVAAIGRLPDIAPGYKATDADTQTVRDIAQHLFKDANAPGIFVQNESQLPAALAGRLAPDVALSPASPDIGAVHRHLDDCDVFFVANTTNQPKSVQAAFRVSGMQPEIWDPMSGRVSPATITEKSASATSIKLNLEPYGSTIVVFSKRQLPAPSSLPAVATVPPAVDLSTGWTVKFGKDGAAMPMEKLTSWTEIQSKLNFSGVATYEKTISVAPEMLKEGLSLAFDFGQATPTPSAGGRGGMGYRVALDPPVREAAILYLNNQRVASLWAPPYTIDVTGKLKAGENTVRIEVANLAINYMASIKLPNYNYTGVTNTYGNRFQPQNLDLVRPLPSGLLGPLRLMATSAAAR
ncbi:MAG: glycosyl hydrolase [Verrucomicrobiota bacterium]|jgi:hypothetical protein